MLCYFICYHTFRKINALIVLIMTQIENTDIPLERKRIFSSQSQLTCPLHGILNGSVTDSCVTWLDVHERFASNSHRHHLQHAQLYNPNTKISPMTKCSCVSPYLFCMMYLRVCVKVHSLSQEQTSVSERLPPQNLPNNSCPHCLDLCRAGLEYKRVL